ncbi:hypothetical protein [Fusobacterium sp.]|uniref:Uncharacterized protein n=1 Tax=Fusobacterium nucleatum TaxID=851 RepID=A0A323TVM7_FUSNU|nr:MULTISPECIES: hypothetical protein [Fusobacterium]PCR85665.1 hypothetical protein CQA79_03120 [Fusobacterium nucleatum]PZA04554.1 hypothetical protein DNF10_05620 [Fusobacterium nucleatum]QJX49611.1 hypothetical protein HOO60_01500 [Fusobacterium nucleatum]HCE32911.1 hypothetical protein [Fusobacterium sp.]
MIIKFIITIFELIGIFLFLYIVIIVIIGKVFFDKDKEELIEKTKELKIDFKRLSKFKKGEYIPIEEVITDFNWLDLQIAIKKQAPNIELCYLVRAYGSIDFKIITANELKELDNARKLDNLFISPLFKILD